MAWVWYGDHTFSVGEILTEETMTKYVTNNTLWLANKPTCLLYRTTGISLGTGSREFIQFDAEVKDNANIHSNTTNPARMTAPMDGVYLIWGTVTYDGNANGVRELYINKNGVDTDIVYRYSANYANGADLPPGASLTTMRPTYLGAGEYMQIGIYQDSGSSRELSGVEGGLVMMGL